MAIVEAQDDDDTEAQLRSQTPEVRVMQDIFDLLVSAFGGKETYPRPESLTAIALEDARTSVRDRSARQALAALGMIAGMVALNSLVFRVLVEVYGA